MTIVGLLDADLQGAREYRTGGFGPLFRTTRVREAFLLPEFLSRVLKAFEQAGVTNVVTLFVDELEVYRDAEHEESSLAQVLEIARAETTHGEDATSFHLMMTHEDDALTHVILVEASVDHPVEEPAITVLDTATVEPPEEGDEEDEPEYEPGADEATGELAESEGEGLAYEAPVEEFLERLLRELDKELALSEPELDVWID